MNRAVFLLTVLLLPLCFASVPEKAGDAAEALVASVDLSEWDDWFTQNTEGIAFKPSDFLRRTVNAEQANDPDAWKKAALEVVFPSLKTAIQYGMLFLGLAVLASVLRGLDTSSATAETAEIAFRAIASTAVLLVVFTEIRSASLVLKRVTNTSEVLLPILLGYLTLGGMEHSAAAIAPLFSLLSDLVLNVFSRIVVPLAAIGGVLLALDVSGNGNLHPIGRILIRGAKWILATVCSVFLLFSVFRGATAGSADGFLLKTAKLALGGIPAVGGVVTESVETAYQCLMLVKNALGFSAAALLVLIAVKPVLSAALMRFALRGASALCEPISGRPYAELLRGLSDTMQVIVLAELASLAMALFALSPVFGVGRFS